MTEREKKNEVLFFSSSMALGRRKSEQGKKKKTRGLCFFREQNVAFKALSASPATPEDPCVYHSSSLISHRQARAAPSISMFERDV